MREPRTVAWSPWTPFDQLRSLLVLGVYESADDLANSLEHLGDMGLLEVKDEAGALHFRVRTDDAARAIALLDDHMQASKN